MIIDSLGRQWSDSRFDRGHAEGYSTSYNQLVNTTTEALNKLSNTASQLRNSITEVADEFAKFSLDPTPVDMNTIDTLNELQGYIEEQNDNLFKPHMTTAPLKIDSDNSISIKGETRGTVNLNTRIVLRNETIENWSASNPILLQGELAVVVDKFFDTVKLKIGDGERHFADLPYVTM